MFSINRFMASAIAKGTSCLTNVIATLTSALVAYKTYMNISYNLFLFTSQPTFYFNLKTKITFFILLSSGLENAVCRFNLSANLMFRDDAQCLLTSAAPMKGNIA